MIKVPFEQQITADRYGRVLLTAKYGLVLEGTVSQSVTSLWSSNSRALPHHVY